MNKNLIILSLSALLSACATPPERNALPLDKVEVSGLLSDPTIRAWADVAPAPETFYEYTDDFDPSILVNDAGELRTQHILTISGGGANGAYGAGLLNGLTDSDQRHDYRLVTGISTGAIIGVYAFLGSDYDHKIRQFYTEYSDANIYQKRSLLSLFSSPSFLNTEPLVDIVRREIDQDILKKVAREHLRGRRFLVKTTNLDAQRGVIWNMGAIALHGTEEAEKLFEDVIIASAAIPGAFNPVLLPVVVDGEVFDELHVDGAVMAQVFYVPENLDIEKYREQEANYLQTLGFEGQSNPDSNVWVISNAKLASEWTETSPSLVGIMARSVATMLRFQTQANIRLIQEQAQSTDYDFNLTYIDHTVPAAPEDAPFNTDYMRALYCYGYSVGLMQESWSTQAPDFAALYEQQIREAKHKSQSSNIAEFNWDTLHVGLSNQHKTCMLKFKASTQL